MQLKQITIEGMGNVSHKTYHLGHLTYINGENGAGKTTIMSAIQLALLGYTGVSGKRVSGVFRHANSHSMSVQLVMETAPGGPEVSVRRTFVDSSKGIQSIVSIDPTTFTLDSIVKDLELPIFNFSELLGMTANAQKDWWMSFLPPADSDITWKTELAEAAKDVVATVKESYIETIASKLDELPMDVTGVRSANTTLKSELSFVQSEINRLGDALQSLVYYGDVPDESAEDIQEKIQRVQAERDKAQAAFIEEANWSRAEAEFAHQLKQLETYAPSQTEGEARAQELMTTATEYQKKLDDLNAKIMQARTAVGSYNFIRSPFVAGKRPVPPVRPADMDIVISEESSNCPIMGTPCESLCAYYKEHKQALRERKDAATKAYNEAMTSYEADLEEYNSAMAGWEATENAREAAYRQAYNQRQAAVDTLQEEQVALMQSEESKAFRLYQALRAQLDVTNAALQARDKFDPTLVKGLRYPSVEGYDAELKELQDTLVHIRANEQYDAITKKMTAEKYENIEKQTLLKVWINLTGVNNLQTHLMEGPFTQFADNTYAVISDLFDKDTTLTFHLTEKANEFSFGISRKGKYIPYSMLSSGEKCMLALTLMTEIVRQSSTDLKLVMIDDMLDHLDDVNIDAVLARMNLVDDVQYIFAGVKAFHNSPSIQDMTTIHVEKE